MLIYTMQMRTTRHGDRAPRATTLIVRDSIAPRRALRAATRIVARNDRQNRARRGLGTPPPMRATLA